MRKVRRLIGSKQMEEYERQRKPAGEDLAELWKRFQAKRNIRIFISSPKDVVEERQKTREVINRLARTYSDQCSITPVFWEDLPLSAANSFQEGIDTVISDKDGIDIAVFILWSRLGSPPGPEILRRDGGKYRSGTEREFDLMMRAREYSDSKRPEILAYLRTDDAAFNLRLNQTESPIERRDLIEQRKMLESFIEEKFRDKDSGASTRAYLSFKDPTSFSEALYRHLKEKIKDLIEENIEEETWEGNPYLGLKPFKSEHASIFFGREEEVFRFTERMSSVSSSPTRFLLVLGPSGSGKSSFVQAGVIPRLQQDLPESIRADWRPLIFTPSKVKGRFTECFCKSLAAEECLPQILENFTMEELIKAAGRDFKSVIDLKIKGILKKSSDKNGMPLRILVVIDQLEEAFSMYSDEEVASFASFLHLLARSEQFFVIGAMRNDFYHLFHENKKLASIKGVDGQFDLLPPDVEDIGSIITIPARMAGYKFEINAEGVRLGRHIIRDLEQDAHALPLLEYVLHELSEAAGEDKLLTFENYNEMGGLRGAIGQRAETIYAEQENKNLMPHIFQALVSIGNDEQAKPIRVKALKNKLCDTAGKKNIVDAFVEARLFTTDGDTVSVTHEALFTQWKRFNDWIEENRRSLVIRKSVDDSYKQWENNGKNKDYLIRGTKPVTDAVGLLENCPDLLSSEVKDYIKASVHRENLGRRLWKAAACLLAVASIALVIASGYALRAERQAKAEKDRAEELANEKQNNIELISQELVLLLYRANFESSDLIMRQAANDFLAKTHGILIPQYDPDSVERSCMAAFLSQNITNSIISQYIEKVYTGKELDKEAKEDLQSALRYVDLMEEILNKMMKEENLDEKLKTLDFDVHILETVASESLLARGQIYLLLDEYDAVVEELTPFIEIMKSWQPENRQQRIARNINLFRGYSNLALAYHGVENEEKAGIALQKGFFYGEKMVKEAPMRGPEFLGLLLVFASMDILDDEILGKMKGFLEENPVMMTFLLHQLGMPEGDMDSLLGELSPDSDSPRVFKITEIIKGSFAERFGAQEGDIILKWGDYWEYFSKEYPEGDGRLFEVIDAGADALREVLVFRDGEILSFSVPPGQFGAMLEKQTLSTDISEIRKAYTQHLDN